MIVICILNLINCTFNKFVLMCIIYPCLMHFHLIIGVRCMFMDIYYLPVCNSILNLLGALLCGCILYLIVYDTCSHCYIVCVLIPYDYIHFWFDMIWTNASFSPFCCCQKGRMNKFLKILSNVISGGA
jgi:hypothetical protein